MFMRASTTLVAKFGTKMITQTGTKIDIKFSGFVPAEDTVISEIYDENGYNIIDQITDNKTEAFMQIVNTCPGGKYFHGIKLSSGKVTLILEP